MELPKGWIKTSLGDITISEKGKKPKTLGEQSSKNSYPYIDIKAFEKGEIRQYTDGEKCRLCEKDDILIVWDGARSGLVGKAINGAIGSTLARVRSNVVENSYLYYFLFGNYNKINTNTKGIGIPHVDPNYLWNLTFLLPPLPEQHRIVEKIEELFSELDNGIEQLQKAKEQIKTYRQSVLKAAFENNNVEKVAFENIILSSQNGISKRSGNEGADYNVLRLADINLGEISEESPRKIKLTDKEIEKYKLSNGDLICIRVNGSKDLVGRMILFNGKQNWAFCDHFIRYKLNLKIVIPKFYKYLFSSETSRKYIGLNMVSSAGQNTVSQKTINIYDVPLPSLTSQKQIVSEIEERFSVADKLEENIDKSLLQAEAMRQSILKKAFEGKLVPQNEEDEPAYELLRRIKTP